VSFSIIGPFSFGAKLTSAQLNQLDTDHSLALDKSTAGDQLAGAVTMASTASITASHAANIVISIAGGLKTTAVGGIQLAGGATDWPTFSATRTHHTVSPMLPQNPNTNWVTSINGYLLGQAVGAAPINIPLRLHDGATLTSLDLDFTIGSTHSGLPSNQPSYGISRLDVSGSAGTVVGLRSGGSVSLGAGSLAAYNAFVGVPVSLAYICDQNNVIDLSRYFYFAEILDENGTNAIAANQYYGIEAFMTVADMRFQ